MQKFTIYSIYDVKAQAYGSPFVALNDALAARVVAQILAYGGNPDYQRYSEDFSLFAIGDFCDDSGLVSSCGPRLVFSLSSIAAQLRGAAVGGESPPKSQSAGVVSSPDAASDVPPACDGSDSLSTCSFPEVQHA